MHVDIYVFIKCICILTKSNVYLLMDLRQIQNADEFNTKGSCVSNNKRRADVGWKSEAESGVVRNDMDGARVR